MHEAQVIALVCRLATDGFAMTAAGLDLDLCRALQREALALEHDAAAIEAGVGRSGGRTTSTEVRRARIAWLTGATAAQQVFLGLAERLRVTLNRELFLGLRAFEAQFALTPAGGFYQRHVDSFRGSRNRVVSLVAYLDESWTVADGGALRVLPPSDEPSAHERDAIDIVPVAGTVVLMLSETVPHEVLPCARPRTNIAGWFRVDD